MKWEEVVNAFGKAGIPGTRSHTEAEAVVEVLKVVASEASRDCTEKATIDRARSLKVWEGFKHDGRVDPQEALRSLPIVAALKGDVGAIPKDSKRLDRGGEDFDPPSSLLSQP